jgi:hypothetical protein
MDKKRPLVIIAVLSVALLIVGLYWSSGGFSSNTELPTNAVVAQSPHYLAFSSGNESKIFLESAKASYSFWSLDDTHIDWFTNGPIIHKGDPVFIINATLRNDYTQNDQYKVDSSNRSFVVLNVKLYDKDGSVIDALQAYPRVDTRLNGHIFRFDSGKTASIGIFMATNNRSIDHYEILVASVSSMPPPS